MMVEEVRHINVDQKYRIVFEQAASTKGILGFKIEVNADDMFIAEMQAAELLDWAKNHAPVSVVEEKREVK